MRWTMQVCTTVCGKTALMASGKPFRPSTTAIRMSWAPRVLSSLTTRSQNLPAQVTFYEARIGTTGTDHLVYEVTNPTGEVATYDVTINIKNPPEQRKPSSGSRI